MNKLDFIIPNWPAPANVKALQTNRHAGFSQAPFNSLNFGTHVNDKAMYVAQNRQLLSQYLPSEPVWLNQTHSITVVDAAQTTCLPEADASFTSQKNVVCAVMTADCLPVLLCDKAGKMVVAVHAGWRGLCDGALEASIDAVSSAGQINASDLMAWLGPAIGPNAFEVGDEVRQQFIEKDAQAANAFKAHNDKYLGNLYQIATQRLHNCGVNQIYGGGRCTYSEKDTFFSYRRDGATGRMATLIWLT